MIINAISDSGLETGVIIVRIGAAVTIAVLVHYQSYPAAYNSFPEIFNPIVLFFNPIVLFFLAINDKRSVVWALLHYNRSMSSPADYDF